MELTTPVKDLNKIGKATSAKLKKLSIQTAGDLLWHLPSRYDDLSNITTIADAQPNTNITIKANIELLQNRRTRNRRMTITEGIVNDETDSIKVIWFNQPYLAKTLEQGEEVYLSGKIEEDRFGKTLKNPTHEKTKQETTHTARIVPIYPTTKNLTQKQIRFLIHSTLPLTQKIPEWIPEQIIKEHKLLGIEESWKNIHFPENHEVLKKAQYRLKFNELFLLQSRNVFAQKELNKYKAPQIEFQEEKIQEITSSLPFTLTDDQKKATWKILQDIEKQEPMNRLLEGDVGSGKTIVAGITMYNTALNGYQAALMAPTEVLAFQHFQTLQETLPKKTKICLLTNSYHLANFKKEITKKQIQQTIASGEIQIVIGTHAIIQKSISFENLGLSIIDEQHRFGVKQRKALRETSGDQKTMPHFLSMSATPIPRSIALSLYGDLDISRIKQVPKNRKPIITRAVNEDRRNKAYDFVKKEIQKGRQAFVVCPLIEESDTLGVKSVETEFKKLSEEIFPDLRIDMIHGKLKAQEKETIMDNFKQKKSDILVSTSVIEVGVDIPNASIIMIEGADRFGIAQLHQFRGRVGRGKHQSYCFLLSESSNPWTKQRLTLLEQNKDGFTLSEADFKLRGPGDVYGTKQSGWIDLKVATIYDQEIMLKAKNAISKIISEKNAEEKYSKLFKKIESYIFSIHNE